jgi:hypothetical protein
MRGLAAAALLLAASPAAATQYLASAPLLPITRLAAGPVTTGDFDGDGHLDVAYGLNNPTGVAVLLGDGQGGCRSPLVSQISSSTSRRRPGHRSARTSAADATAAQAWRWRTSRAGRRLPGRWVTGARGQQALAGGALNLGLRPRATSTATGGSTWP